MAAGKWIKDLSAQTPLVDAARRVLAVRLETVRDYLGPAVFESEKDPENIHQLRVATRRCNAALGIFAFCLPAKMVKAAKRTLRHFRRAAGAARDWDVFIEWLGEEAKRTNKAEAHAGIDCLIGYAVAQRLWAQEEICAAVPDPFAFDRLQAELLAAVRSADSSGEVLLDLARPTLHRLVRDLNEAGSKDRDDFEKLHEVRIIGKRLRYAMEVFASCFPRKFRDVYYAAIEQMQEILGRANDSHVTIDRLSQLSAKIGARIPKQWNRYKADFSRLLKFHQERLPAERHNFERWWQTWQQESTGCSGLLRILRDD